MPDKIWIAHEGALCLTGYPIRIVRGKKLAWLLKEEGLRSAEYGSLAMAKLGGETYAKELDEFEGYNELSCFLHKTS